MKWSATVLSFLLAAECSLAFVSKSGNAPSTTRLQQSTVASETSSDTSRSSSNQKDPLLIRAAKGEKVERTPVWMMRQAGRHIKEYRDLCQEYPTFRQRSEIPEVAVEVSLQPWRNYKTDGCILFSDILTPLPGMGAEFTIDEQKGPIMTPMRTMEDVKKVCAQYALYSLYAGCISVHGSCCHAPPPLYYSYGFFVCLNSSSLLQLIRTRQLRLWLKPSRHFVKRSDPKRPF